MERIGWFVTLSKYLGANLVNREIEQYKKLRK